MRTGRSLTVCGHLLHGGGPWVWGVSAPQGGLGGCLVQGVVCLVWGGVSAPGGGWCAWSEGVVCLVWGGCLLPGGGVPGPGLGGVCWGGGGNAWSRGGGCLLRGGLASQHALRQTPSPLWTESQTPVKTLPWPNFVAAGKDGIILSEIDMF